MDTRIINTFKIQVQDRHKHAVTKLLDSLLHYIHLLVKVDSFTSTASNVG